MRQGNNHKTYRWRECGAIWRTFGSPPTLHPSLKRPILVSEMLSLYFFHHYHWAFQVWESKSSCILLRVCVVRHFASIAPRIFCNTLSRWLIIPTTSKETESLKGWMTCPGTHLAKYVSPTWPCEPWAPQQLWSINLVTSVWAVGKVGTYTLICVAFVSALNLWAVFFVSP